MTAGPHRGRTIAEVVWREGALVASDLREVPAQWPVVLLGDPDPALAHDLAGRPLVLRAHWNSWTASVHPAAGPAAEAVATDADVENVLAAICAAALGVHEAFGAVQALPGSDVGYRAIHVNLWHPAAGDGYGPRLTYAPTAWWLVGLGHLGQANAWVLSWLPYADPEKVPIVLQDVDKAVDANHSTGMFTPRGPAPVHKTRLVAAHLDVRGFDTCIVERRLDEKTRVTEEDVHVALLGVDNLSTRRKISDVGWHLAIDAGLGAGPHDFNAIQIRRFPAVTSSGEVPAWAEEPKATTALPRTSAFDDLARRDACGAVQLAGTAVGAAFVGVIAACLAIAEATRPLLGGTGLDVLSLHLGSDDLYTAPATRDEHPIAVRLHQN